MRTGTVQGLPETLLALAVNHDTESHLAIECPQLSTGIIVFIVFSAMVLSENTLRRQLLKLSAHRSSFSPGGFLELTWLERAGGRCEPPVREGR